VSWSVRPCPEVAAILLLCFIFLSFFFFRICFLSFFLFYLSFIRTFELYFFLFHCLVLFYLSFSFSSFLFLHLPFLPSFFTLVFIFSLFSLYHSSFLSLSFTTFIFFPLYVHMCSYHSQLWHPHHNRQVTRGASLFHPTVTLSEHGRSMKFHMPKYGAGEYLLLKMLYDS
jgi:hypothetical protein